MNFQHFSQEEEGLWGRKLWRRELLPPSPICDCAWCAHFIREIIPGSVLSLRHAGSGC